MGRLLDRAFKLPVGNPQFAERVLCVNSLRIMRRRVNGKSYVFGDLQSFSGCALVFGIGIGNGSQDSATERDTVRSCDGMAENRRGYCHRRRQGATDDRVTQGSGNLRDRVKRRELWGTQTMCRPLGRP